jgi:hypothetical protein
MHEVHLLRRMKEELNPVAAANKPCNDDSAPVQNSLADWRGAVSLV